MDLLKRLSLLFAVGVFASAQQPPVDPVMKARAQRGQGQGLNEGDLPPVPRGVVEPPPLPPPELHPKDTKGYRPTKAHARAAAKLGKGHKSKHSAPVAKKPGRSKKKGKA